MKKRKTAAIGFVLGVTVIIALGSMAVRAADSDAAKQGKECTMQEMHECVMKCSMHCEKNMKETSEAIVLLDEAVKAIDAGNTDNAKKEIEKARTMLKEIHKTQKKCMEKMPTVNDRCPITGNKIDMMNTPENLIKMYKGKKVGFCCPACPPQWDKLTDAEKDAKLEKVMPKLPVKEEPMKNMPEAGKARP
jgi:cellobiose-specific phosphotransferase system component IIA